jgi:hypothetical protein
MQYGLLSYTSTHGTYNLGDNVQSLAARQYLPRVDNFINREAMADFECPESQLILNGWFTHNPSNWVPSPAIKPLFVSFHLNSSAADRMLSEKGVNYLKNHAPIGCRDRHTVRVLESHGIAAYFSGCLTLTLSGYRNPNPTREKCYIVDPLFNFPDLPDLFASPKRFLRGLRKGEPARILKKQRLLKQIFAPAFYKSAQHKKHVLPSAGVTVEAQFTRAESYLRDYADAKLVVTSRIHCALPCLAMGVPVIFINAFDDYVDSCRFDGLLELFNRIDIAPDGSMTNNFGLKGRIDGSFVPKNLTVHEPLAAKLRAVCEGFVLR